MPLKITDPEIIQKMIADYNSGITQTDLGIRYDCDFRTVNKILKNHNVEIKTQPRKVPQEICDKIIRLYSEGTSGLELARMLSLNKDTVFRILKNAKVDVTKNKFTPEEEQTIVNEYLNGTSLTQLRVLHSCLTYETFRNILKRHKIKLRAWGGIFKTLDEKGIEEFKNQWNSNMSIDALKEIYNISVYTLNRWVKQCDLELRVYTGGRGEEHGNWKGGRIVDKYGYVSIWINNDDPFKCMANSTGYIREHRYVMAKYLSRPLLDTESVHHINGKKDDNRIENLELRVGQHGAGQSLECTECGSFNIKSDNFLECLDCGSIKIKFKQLN